MNLNHTLRSLVLGMPKMLRGRPGERAGEERLIQHRLALSRVAPLVVMSPAFVKGSHIPVAYTADGAGLSPPLRWGAGPPGTRSWVVWMEDPDAPTPPALHPLARRGSLLRAGFAPRGHSRAGRGCGSARPQQPLARGVHRVRSPPGRPPPPLPPPGAGTRPELGSRTGLWPPGALPGHARSRARLWRDGRGLLAPRVKPPPQG
ncbi:YbhB and YbcL [Stigmatella aurantiaca DW4/3-1]|uniref:YbhB and YbcL n=1 Tax=Stigmatella aurantiaca (strain DW4/3-1) TaxID=378806 RepID=Q094S1_STIAD|nr:YbhB and YbcL [Stigmatella aurantiaca DW4/3-1]